MVGFVRRIWGRYSKLGKRRKKKQIWRRPTGRDNKMREKRRGYPAVVSVGYQKDKKLKGQVQGKKPIRVDNIKDLEKIKKGEIIILGRIGKRKKIELVKKAKEKGLEIYNINIKKFLKKTGKSTQSLAQKEKKNESK